MASLLLRLLTIAHSVYSVHACTGYPTSICVKAPSLVDTYDYVCTQYTKRSNLMFGCEWFESPITVDSFTIIAYWSDEYSTPHWYLALPDTVNQLHCYKPRLDECGPSDWVYRYTDRSWSNLANLYIESCEYTDECSNTIGSTFCIINSDLFDGEYQYVGCNMGGPYYSHPYFMLSWNAIFSLWIVSWNHVPHVHGNSAYCDQIELQDCNGNWYIWDEIQLEYISDHTITSGSCDQLNCGGNDYDICIVRGVPENSMIGRYVNVNSCNPWNTNLMNEAYSIQYYQHKDAYHLAFETPFESNGDFHYTYQPRCLGSNITRCYESGNQWQMWNNGWSNATELIVTDCNDIDNECYVDYDLALKVFDGASDDLDFAGTLRFNGCDDNGYPVWHQYRDINGVKSNYSVISFNVQNMTFEIHRKYDEYIYASCNSLSLDYCDGFWYPNSTNFTLTKIATTTVNPTIIPTTSIPTTSIPTTFIPTTYIPTTSIPTTSIPNTSIVTSSIPNTSIPTTSIPTTSIPTTSIPTTSKSTEIACGDEITGDYKGEYITFTLQMRFGGDLQFDARLSEIDLLYLRGFNSAGEMIQNDLDHDKQLILSDVTSGDYHFEIHGKSGTNGMYNVKLICTFDEQSVIETLATDGPLNTMQYKGNDEDAHVNPYLIPVLLSTLILILICCGKCAMYYLYQKRFQKHDQQKPNPMIQIGQMAIQPRHSLSNDNDVNALDESLVSRWLKESVHLPQYIPLFIENGFDSMKSVKNIDDKKQLYAIGIMNKEHQTFIMREIKKYQEQRGQSKGEVDAVFEDDGEGFGEPHINVYDEALHPRNLLQRSDRNLVLQNTKGRYGAFNEESDDESEESDSLHDVVHIKMDKNDDEVDNNKGSHTTGHNTRDAMKYDPIVSGVISTSKNKNQLI